MELHDLAIILVGFWGLVLLVAVMAARNLDKPW